jgi:hypothetical protein
MDQKNSIKNYEMEKKMNIKESMISTFYTNLEL